MSKTIENLAEALHAIDAAKSALTEANYTAGPVASLFILQLIRDAEELRTNISALSHGMQSEVK